MQKKIISLYTKRTYVNMYFMKVNSAKSGRYTALTEGLGLWRGVRSGYVK